MKRLQLPSVVQVSAALADVVRRFPWAVFMAALGTGAAITLVELRHESGASAWPAVRLILTAAVGLPLALAINLRTEAGGWPPVRRRLAELAAVGWPPICRTKNLVRKGVGLAFSDLSR